MSDALGRPIGYQPMPPNVMADGMRALGRPEWLIEHALELAALMSEPKAAEVTGTVEQITGRSPKRLSHFLTENAAAFPRGGLTHQSRGAETWRTHSSLDLRRVVGHRGGPRRIGPVRRRTPHRHLPPPPAAGEHLEADLADPSAWPGVAAQFEQVLARAGGAAGRLPPHVRRREPCRCGRRRRPRRRTRTRCC